MKKNTKKGLVGLATAALAFKAIDLRLQVKKYHIVHHLIHSPVRIILLTDLHNNLYGTNQAQLVKLIRQQKGDLILLGGDMIDERHSILPTLQLVDQLAQDYPVYSVTGNHEYANGDLDAIRSAYEKMGVINLQGDTYQIKHRDSLIELSGIDDSGRSPDYPQQLQAASRSRKDPNAYQILLAHRPEYIQDYLPHRYHLILSGHTHGGQINIPGLGGLYAPGQGLFPKYDAGQFDFIYSTMIVSRGLSSQYQVAPRLFNRPEIVVVDLTGVAND